MYYSDNHQCNNEKIFKALEKVLETKRIINEYEHKIKSINEAMRRNNHQKMVKEINNKWKIYKDFTNGLSSFTNYYVYSVDDHFYDDKPTEYLVNQLNDIKIVIALKLLLTKQKKN